MNNKRVEYRICTAFTARCSELPDMNNSFYTAIKDISTGGLQIICEKKLPAGKIFNIKINLIHKTAETRAKVTWITELLNSDRYCIGLEFLESDDEGKQTVEDFLDTIYMDAISCYNM